VISDDAGVFFQLRLLLDDLHQEAFEALTAIVHLGAELLIVGHWFVLCRTREQTR
jgi:hypothetical protein